MLNLVMTHSSRTAAIANNKRIGSEAVMNPAIRHRLAWRRKDREAAVPMASHPIEAALRERTA